MKYIDKYDLMNEIKIYKTAYGINNVYFHLDNYMVKSSVVGNTICINGNFYNFHYKTFFVSENYIHDIIKTTNVLANETVLVSISFINYYKIIDCNTFLPKVTYKVNMAFLVVIK